MTVKAWIKKRKIRALFEAEISDWDLEFWNEKRIAENLRIEAEIVAQKKLRSYIEVEMNRGEIEAAAKTALYEILEDAEFKTGLKQAVRDSIKNKFMNYLDNLGR